MKKASGYALLVLIIISFFLKFLFVLFSPGLYWWDEAVYLGLGKGIQEGRYSLDGRTLESFRPPLFPLIISPLSGNPEAVRVLVAIISVFSVITAYYLARELFGKRAALWSALFLSTNQLFMFFSTKALTEPLFIIFLSLSLIFLLRRERGPVFPVLSGIFCGLAFMTRYLGTILIISYLLFFLYILFFRKGRRQVLWNMVMVSIGLLIALTPWFAMNSYHYGNVLGGYLENFTVYSDAIPSDMSQYFVQFNRIFGYQIIFILGGLYFTLKSKNRDHIILLSILFILPLIFFILAPHKEARYLLSFYPVYSIFAASILLIKKKSYKRITFYAVIIICILSMWNGYDMLWNESSTNDAMVEGSLYLKGLIEPGEGVLTGSYPYVYCFSGGRGVLLPESREEVLEILSREKIRYVLLNEYETGNPAYVNGFFDQNEDFVLVESFEQWGDPDAVRIYEYKG